MAGTTAVCQAPPGAEILMAAQASAQVDCPGRASIAMGTPRASGRAARLQRSIPGAGGSKKCPRAGSPGTGRAGLVSLFFLEAPKPWRVGESVGRPRRAIFLVPPIFTRAPGQHVNQRWHPSCSAPRIIFGDPASPPKIRGEFFLLFSLFIFRPPTTPTAWVFSTRLPESALPFLPTPPSRPRNLSTRPSKHHTTTRPEPRARHCTHYNHQTSKLHHYSHQPCRARLRTRPPLSPWRPCPPRPACPPPPSLPRPSTSRRLPLSMSTSSSASAIR